MIQVLLGIRQGSVLRAAIGIAALAAVVVLAAAALLRGDVFVSTPGSITASDLTITNASAGDVTISDSSTYDDVVTEIGVLGDDATLAVPQFGDLPADLLSASVTAITNPDTGDGTASVAFVGTYDFTEVGGLNIPGVRVAVVATWQGTDTAG